MTLYMQARGLVGDYCTRPGAEELAAAIKNYWAQRGQVVKVELVNTGFHPAMRAARIDVRSDMKNGLPAGGRA